MAKAMQEWTEIRDADIGAASPASPPDAVAWQVKDYADGWITYCELGDEKKSAERRARKQADATGAVLRPLYAVPPAPPSDVVAGEPTDAEIGTTACGSREAVRNFGNCTVRVWRNGDHVCLYVADDGGGCATVSMDEFTANSIAYAMSDVEARIAEAAEAERERLREIGYLAPAP